MVADSAAELAERDPSVWRVVDRFATHPGVQDFVPLAARFTALKDLADRPTGVQRAAVPVRMSRVDTLGSAGA
jgi:hypothetical protein